MRELAVEGIRCTDPTRTLIDLGSVIDDAHLERALESALRRRLTSIPRLRWRLGQLSRPGRPGPPALRQVLERRPTGTPPTESELETRFSRYCERPASPIPFASTRSSYPGGGTVRLDFAYPERMLLMETNGWGPHRSRRAFVRDHRRENRLVLLGWKPLGFTWDDVTLRPEKPVAEVEAARARVPDPEGRRRTGADPRRGGPP